MLARVRLHFWLRSVPSVIKRVCFTCPRSDEEIDFEQYSSGYSSAEVSPSDFWVKEKEPCQGADI